MIPEKYAKYYKGKPVMDFTKLYPELTAPSYHIHGREWNSGYRMDWFCVTEPFLMINEPHTHDFDQFLAFQNADVYRPFVRARASANRIRLVLRKQGILFV